MNKSTLRACGQSEQKHIKRFWTGHGVRRCKRSPASRSCATARTPTLTPHSEDMLVKRVAQGSWVLPRIRSRVGGESPFQVTSAIKQQGVGVCESTPALTPPHVTCFVQLKRHFRVTCLFRQIHPRCPVSSPRKLPAVIPVCGQMTMTSFGRPTSGIISGKCIPKESVLPGKTLS